MKSKKLATNLSIIIGVALAVIFVVFITVSVQLTSSALTTSLNAEFNILSLKNGIQAQSVFDDCGSLGSDLQAYIGNAYDVYDEQVANGNLDTNRQKGILYETPMYPINVEIEKYIDNTIKASVTNNAAIVGAGVYFEPHQFDDQIRDYSLYLDVKDVGNPISFGAYETYSEEVYYKNAKETKKPFFTDPFKKNGKWIISASFPIIVDQFLHGVIVVDIDITIFNELAVDTSVYPTMYNDIMTENSTIVFDSSDLSGGNIGKSSTGWIPDKEEFDTVLKGMTGTEAFSLETTNTKGNKVTRFYSPVTAGADMWWSLTAVETKDMNKAITTTATILIVMALVALIFIIVATVVILNRKINPINEVVRAAESIAKGNFNIELQPKSNDEIGILARTFDATAKTLKSLIQDIANVLTEIANKNLDVRTNAEYVGDLAEIKGSMDGIIGSLNGVMGNINESSDQVSSGSEQVASGSQALSQGATEQASSIEELSATINEMSIQIRENAENAGVAKASVEQTSIAVLSSNESMQTMIKAMTEISEKSSEISKIIKTIEDIAFQTNILALNAAVEAARAGAAGKGFAVVADEVRNLAGKSAEAAKNTTQLIEETVSAVENGTKIAGETAQAMLSVVEGARVVTELIDEIADASEKQANAASQVTLGIDQIASVVQTNSATAEQSAAASEELSGQASILKSMVNEFKLKR